MNKNENLAAQIRIQLEPDENLLCCEYKDGKGIGFILFGALLLFFALYALSQDYLEIGYTLTFGLSGLLCIVPGLLQITAWKNNYFYITNKRLCMATKKGTETVLLHSIQGVQKAMGGGRKSRYYFIHVQLKDGNFVNLRPGLKSIDVMLETLQKLIIQD